MIVTIEEEEPRVPFEDVVGKQGGASPRGSTYYRRLQTCPREHLLGNVLKWEPVPRAHALDFGLLWHYGLETYYRHVQLTQRGYQLPITADRAAFQALQPFRDQPGWPKIYEQIGRMLDSYLTRWIDADRYWEILGVETQLGVGLDGALHGPHGFPQTTRLDLVIRDWSSTTPVGRHVEHKSTWRLEPNMLVGYSQDDQVLGQIYLAEPLIDWRALGVFYAGAIVNLTTKTKEPSNERIPVFPSRSQLASWRQSKRYWHEYAQQLEHDLFADGQENLPESTQNDLYPKNFTQCIRRWGRCGYFNFCRNYPEENFVQIRRRHVDDELPEGFRKRDFVPGATE